MAAEGDKIDRSAHRLVWSLAYNEGSNPHVGVTSQTLAFSDYNTMCKVQDDLVNAMIDALRQVRDKHAAEVKSGK